MALHLQMNPIGDRDINRGSGPSFLRAKGFRVFLYAYVKL